MTAKRELAPYWTNIRVSKEELSLLRRCGELIQALPEGSPQREMFNFLVSLDGNGKLHSKSNKRLSSGVVVLYALRSIEIALDRQGETAQKALKFAEESAEKALENYKAYLGEANKERSDDPKDPNEIRSMG